MADEAPDEVVGKRCSTCHRWVPRSGYNRRASSPDGLQPRCRDCCRAWYAEHREQHKRNVATRNRRVRDEHGQRLVEYLAQHPCVDCGETDVRVLEFDHLDPTTKTTEVVKLVEQQAAWERVEAEIAKCDVCCANCHRVRTAERADQRRHRYERARREADAEASAARLRGLLPWR